MKSLEESKKWRTVMEEKKKEKQKVRKGGCKKEGGRQASHEMRADFSPQSSGAIHCIFMTLPESE